MQQKRPVKIGKIFIFSFNFYQFQSKHYLAKSSIVIFDGKVWTRAHFNADEHLAHGKIALIFLFFEIFYAAKQICAHTTMPLFGLSFGFCLYFCGTEYRFECGVQYILAVQSDIAIWDQPSEFSVIIMMPLSHCTVCVCAHLNSVCHRDVLSIVVH